MRKPLEKNEFLLQFEALLKKHGCSTVYCESGFDGTKKGGLSYTIVAPRNHEVNQEFNKLLDPVWDLDEYDWHDMSGLTICPLSEEAIARQGSPIYEKGEFYAVGGGDDLSER